MKPIRIPRYPHFDGLLSEQAARELVLDPARVALHPFLPFIRRSTARRKFRKQGKPVTKKKRPLTYACRKDSVIFRHYRELLVAAYEPLIRSLDIQDCVIAYRSVAGDDGHFKSNVDFAVDAFEIIRNMGNATVLCLDIKSYFDNIGHDLVYETWKRLTGYTRLPDDHFNVARAATRYSYIDEKALLGILGFFGLKTAEDGRQVRGFLKPRRSLPKRLCSRSVFSKRVARNVTVNTLGIAQGLPISDVLANAVLLDFDIKMKQVVTSSGGIYRRYSDDLLFVLPNSSLDVTALLEKIENGLTETCTTLKIGHDKTAIFRVIQLENSSQEIIPVTPFKQAQRIDYLGLSYDGRKIGLRESTISRLKGRIVRRVRKQVGARFSELTTQTPAQLRASLHLQGIMREFGRIESKHRSRLSPKRGPSGSFRCYAVRAATRAGIDASAMLKQISHLADFVRDRAEVEIKKLIP